MTQWQPIESAPRQYGVIPLWITTWPEMECTPDCRVAIGHVNEDGTVSDYGRDMTGTASHWMPLPEPPTA